MIFFWFLVVLVACVWIQKSCDPFEGAADYLGRNMKAGTKGATINAIASSMPEFLTTVIFLFFYHDRAGFAAGIGTTAGSAMFNAFMIPAACSFAVFFYLKLKNFEISKSCIVRDGIFLIVAELALIIILAGSILTWWHGFMLIAIYLAYVSFMLWQNKKLNEGEEQDDGGEDEEGAEINNHHWFRNFCAFDYRNMLHRNCQYSTRTAIIALGLAVVNISGACYFLVEAVVNIAEIFKMDTFFVAVIVAAAATSVPDTIISVRDAMKGNYDDSIANAVGSNIFDICVCLGGPLMAYALIYGDISLPQSAGVTELRVLLLAFSVLVILMLMIPKRIGYGTPIVLVGCYVFYAVYSWCRGMDMAWANNIGFYITKAVDLI